MNCTVTIEDVTVKRAHHYLTTLMEGQRPLREGHILRIATEIESDNWHTTGDCLIFVKGRLANGQHRLHAMILADKTCQFLVMRTDDEKIYKVLDCGIGRTTSDALHYMNVDMAKDVAAVAMMVLRYEGGALTVFGRNSDKCNKITRSLVIDYVEEHKEKLEKQVDYCVKLNQKKRIVTPTLAATLLHLATKSGKGDCMTFINNLYLGGSDDAAFDLRERLIRDKGNKFRLAREHTFALMIKAYKSFINGTRPGVLKAMEGEAFPLIP